MKGLGLVLADRLERYVCQAVTEAWTINRDIVPQVAAAIATAYLDNHQIYAFGSGHSHLLVEEMYYRAGGLNIVRPIWVPQLMLHQDPQQASRWEQTPGYSRTILDTVHWKAGDVVWLISNSGRNPLIVELAQAARGAHAVVIALLSRHHAETVEARSVSGEKLYDVADYVLDNGGVAGDAGFAVKEGWPLMFPTSTVVGASLVHWVWIEVAQRLQQAGAPPEVYTSFNLDHVRPTGTP